MMISEPTERGGGTPLQFAPGPNDPRWPAILSERPDLAPSLSIGEADRIETEAAVEPPLRRVADGLPDRLDRSGLILGNAMSNRTKRLSRLGNAVVPQCAESIGRRIMEHARNAGSADRLQTNGRSANP
jgi:site-specific DNA-cytosine methylase